MYCIGVTGNIASGKSTAIECFKTLGAFVVVADNIAKALTLSGQPAFLAISNHFGKRVINLNGELNRPLLRKLIFANGEQRLWLEKLLHPLIRAEIIRQVSLGDGPYCVIEIPLLYSRQDYPWLDRILVILAQRHTEIERIIKRDNCNEKEAMAVLAVQADELSLRQIADDVIINNDTKEQFKNRLKKLHESYLHLANEKSL